MTKYWTEKFNHLVTLAAIAQWILCAYHPAAPGSSPKHAIYAFILNSQIFMWEYFKNNCLEGIWQTLASFSFIFVFSNTNYIFLKNVHPVYGAGIWTHDLQNISLLNNH